MAKKDDILKSFLKHEILESKYKLKQSDMPSTIREAINSNTPIIKVIALIVEKLEGNSNVTERELRTQVTKILNEAI
jgi:hypothetical protein